MRRELLLVMKDLRYVGVVCKDCGTEVILDMESTYKARGGGQGEGLRSRCLPHSPPRSTQR